MLFLLLNLGVLQGQVIRLKKSTGDGGIPPDSVPQKPPCIQNNANTMELTIQNLWDSSITISSIDLFSNPDGIFQEENMETNIMIPSLGLHSFTLNFSEDWGSLLSSQYFTIDYYFTYEVSDEEQEYIPSTSPSIVDDFKIQYSVCKKDAQYADPKNDKRISSQPLDLYPNPTTSSFSLNYSIDEKSDVNISLHNNLGQKIDTILDMEQHDIGKFNINTSIPEYLPKGVYHIVTKINDEMSVYKLVKI